MKKYKYYLVIMIIILTIPIVYKFFVKQHKVIYKINNFDIIETMNIKDKKHYYTFDIKKGKEEYSYEIENKIHKRKKIIKDIKYFKSEGITCIIPIYKNNKEKEIYCRQNNEQVSKELLKDDTSYQEILDKAKKYNVSNLNSSSTKKEYKNITIYSGNIPPEYTIIIWNYKGIVVMNSDSNKYYQFLDYDLYDNIMATTTDHYFVLFENTSVNGIENIHYFDIKKNKYKVFSMKEKISKDSYINGVIKDTIYVTDKKKEKQYAIDISKELITEVGNEEDSFIMYIDNQEKKIGKREFLKEKQYFNEKRIIDEKITKDGELFKEDSIYYFKENNIFYKQLENYNRIQLFEAKENIDEWQIYKKDIILLKDEELYLYQDNSGLNKLLEYNELKYNKQNIYYLWK